MATNPKGAPEDVPKNVAQEKERFFTHALFKNAQTLQ